MLLARLMGMAKPTFMARAGFRMAELMPITSPSKLNSGPPELPWLMAASVWMKSDSRDQLVDGCGSWR